jgi:hypothetical protein
MSPIILNNCPFQAFSECPFVGILTWLVPPDSFATITLTVTRDLAVKEGLSILVGVVPLPDVAVACVLLVGCPRFSHRHLINIDCLMARTACLVCFISTVNGCSKKKKKKKLPWKTAASSGHVTKP